MSPWCDIYSSHVYDIVSGVTNGMGLVFKYSVLAICTATFILSRMSHMSSAGRTDKYIESSFTRIVLQHDLIRSKDMGNKVKTICVMSQGCYLCHITAELFDIGQSVVKDLFYEAV